MGFVVPKNDNEGPTSSSQYQRICTSDIHGPTDSDIQAVSQAPLLTHGAGKERLGASPADVVNIVA